ncbi:hypothetical protein ABTY98_02135 [Streptomyces sp. NPDC096040]|uniref:hypothetical protein n=1 Tax=Streptomyces sp. NPDC096040 TaxID=3155541 RepID=UPI00331A6DBF
MKNLAKRIAVTVSSVAVAGAAVLGAGGTASAATPTPARVQHSGVSVKTHDYRWDHGVGYLLEQGYSWDAVRGWHRDGRATDSATSGSSYRHDGYRYEHGDRYGHHLDRNYGDR